MGIIRVYSRDIVVPRNSRDADIFIGKWKKSQNRAVEEAIGLTKNSIKGYTFDNIVDELTVKYYVEDNQ